MIWILNNASSLPADDRSPVCRLHTELRNITKGNCYLDQVEVSFCRGRCTSWTNVLAEVRWEMWEEPPDLGTYNTGRRRVPLGKGVGHYVPRRVSCLSSVFQEPYLQTVCDCCSYRLDPDTPVKILNLQCEDGEEEPVVLPIIQSCECSSCQGECCQRGVTPPGQIEIQVL